MLKTDLIKRVVDFPRDAAFVRRWDFAATEPKAGADPDHTAGALVAYKGGQAWLVDMRRARLSPLGVERLVKATAEDDARRYGHVSILLEQEPGSSGAVVVDHYRREVLPGFPVHVNKVTGSKVQRAEPLASCVEAGNFHMLRADWNDAFLDEAASFPAGAHDDQVDAAADGFAWLARCRRWRGWKARAA
jgi:predicted phage terminase large subunit-like protein